MISLTSSNFWNFIINSYVLFLLVDKKSFLRWYYVAACYCYNWMKKVNVSCVNCIFPNGKRTILLAPWKSGSIKKIKYWFCAYFDPLWYFQKLSDALAELPIYSAKIYIGITKSSSFALSTCVFFILLVQSMNSAQFLNISSFLLHLLDLPLLL